MKKTHILILLTLLCVSCAVSYQMTLPEHFKRYDTKKEFKLITANGVRLKAREEKNYPKANLEFWTDATKEHLVKSGYNHIETICFVTDANHKGCTLRFIRPLVSGDWVFQETIFVFDDTLILLEAAGEFEKFAVIKDDLDTALKTFKPR